MGDSRKSSADARLMMESNHSYERTSTLTQCPPEDVPVQLPGPSHSRALFWGSHQAISITDILDLFKFFFKMEYGYTSCLQPTACISQVFASCCMHLLLFPSIDGLWENRTWIILCSPSTLYDSVDVRIPGLLNVATKWSHRIRASRAIGVKKVLV